MCSKNIYCVLAVLIRWDERSQHWTSRHLLGPVTWSYRHQDKHETWLTAYSPLGETREHTVKTVRVCMCVYIHLHAGMESWWRQVFQADGKQESPPCTDEWRPPVFQSMAQEPLWGPRGQNYLPLRWHLQGWRVELLEPWQEPSGVRLYQEPLRSPRPHIHSLQRKSISPKNVVDEAVKKCYLY